MRPTVYNRRTDKDHGGIYVGRPSPWGNPYIEGRDGTRLEVIELYRSWIAQRPELVEQLRRINPSGLICWCAPLPCHADVLADLLEERA